MQGFMLPATERDLLLWTRWRYRPQDEDRTWDWWEIFLECKSSRGRYECYAAIAQNELQGLMQLDLKPRSMGPAQRIVVDYLATNPANRVADQGLKHVGIGLLALAVVLSFEFRKEGRIRLESLSGAVGFYESLGMVRQARRSRDGNSIFELGSEEAKQLLEEIRERRILAV